MGNWLSSDTILDPSPQILEEIRNYISPIHPGIRNVIIFESDHSCVKEKKHIYLKVKDSDGQYYQKPYLAYVLLHLYTCTLTESIGHTSEFWSNFSNLQKKANELNIRLNQYP